MSRGDVAMKLYTLTLYATKAIKSCFIVLKTHNELRPIVVKLWQNHRCDVFSSLVIVCKWLRLNLLEQIGTYSLTA